MGTIQTVPMSSIRLPKVAMRGVESESADFIGLVDSIKSQGFIGTISVRQLKDDQTNETFFEVMDGSQRYGACMALGFTEMPVDIIDRTEEEVLVSQIMMNAHRVDTKPMQYCHQILRILAIRPNTTFAELASELGKSPVWIENMLKLKNIKDKEIRDLVDKGVITLSNAYALSQLPEDEQRAFFDQARTQDAQTFTAATKARKRELDAERRKGRSAQEATFVPTPHLRRLNVLRDTLENPEPVMDLLSANNVSDVGEAVTWTLKWVLGLDPASVAEQRQDFEERARKREEQKAAREREKAEREAAAAAATTN